MPTAEEAVALSAERAEAVYLPYSDDAEDHLQAVSEIRSAVEYLTDGLTTSVPGTGTQFVGANGACFPWVVILERDPDLPPMSVAELHAWYTHRGLPADYETRPRP